jgi:hypothetical protein
MKTFTLLVNTHNSNNNYFTIHAPDCKDIGREEAIGNVGNKYNIRGIDLEDAIQQEIDIFTCQEQGYKREHFKIAPCCKHVQDEQFYIKRDRRAERII